VMFHGKHQPGITTPLQARGHLIAFDLSPGAGRKEAAALMRRWSATAERLMAGEPVTGGSADGTGHDTGIALDAGPSSLTVTFGFGATFFERTGLTGHRPPGLDPLPPFSADHLDTGRSNGDLWVQIGADDALVAFHALRAVQKEAASTATVRWQMDGFNRTPGATAKPMT
ncbi:Dyp-type peroxidase, partial [Polaromonas sp. P5_E6]